MRIEQPSILEIVTTVSNETEAHAIAIGGVESGFVACAQIDGPLTSVYRWENAIQTANEFRLTLKVALQKRDLCLAWLKSHHPYQTPEILVRVVETTESYADWVNGGSGSQTVDEISR